MAPLTIGRLARRAGVGVETIRYYHREGLLPRPAKPPVGYRTYPPEATRDLGFIKRAQALGFTLAEIRGMLVLFRSEGATCGEVAGRARDKLAEVREKIAALREIEGALIAAAEACEACAPASPCPVLDRFPFDRDTERCAAPDGAACTGGSPGRGPRADAEGGSP